MSDELQFATTDGALCTVAIGAYPDTMPLIQQPLGVPYRVLLRPTSLASFMAAMFWVDAVTERRNFIPHLALPFVPGARQDRLNDTGDYLFTAKSVAKELNARNFPSVTVLDPHSEVTPALIDRCRVVHAADCINPPAGKYAAVIAPDAGAEKRAGMVARKLGVPLIHAWKTRDVATGAITGFGLDVSVARDARGWIATKPLLVVDDICDGGGTFTGLAAAIQKSVEVELHLFTTHGIYSKGLGALAEHFSHIYCTDSILRDPNGALIQIDVCKKLLEGTL